jgi:N-carbamoyl-L-amino-acid hydrolase
MTKIASNLQIDSARLWDTIHETAKFGATPKGGVRRLTLGPEDKQVRDWFRNACEAAGLEVHVDALGSMFGLRKGRDMSKPPVGLGSHLDTQPTGGKFDGVLGTLAALEVVRTLNDAGIETETPICIVNWTNEEGSRFAPAMMASAAYAGDYTTDDILSRKDAEGVTRGEALDSIGYRGASPVGARNSRRFVELHIEQGPMLEAENKTIGVVDSGQGVCGTTARSPASKAMPAPRRCRCAATRWRRCRKSCWRWSGAKAHGPKAVGTIGEAVIANPSRNVIPGEIAFTGGYAAAPMPRSWTLDKDLRAAIAEIAARRKVEVSARSDLAQAADVSIPNWSTRSRTPPRRSAIRIAASPPAPATTPATSNRDAGGDGVRALQGRHQPQRAGGRDASRLHGRRQRADAYRAGAGRRRILIK